MTKGKISTKLFFTYFVLILFSYIITAVMFNYILYKYTILETKHELLKEAKIIAKTLNELELDNKTIAQKIATRHELRVAGRLINSYIVVLNEQNKVIYSNININTLLQLRNNNSKDYISERIKLVNQQGSHKGTLILATKIKDIKTLNNIIIRTLFFSLLISITLAFILALLFSFKITKPIKQLKNAMLNFTSNKVIPNINIKTNDEIEDLANCFNELTLKIKQYDEQQKLFLQNTSHELKTPLTSIQGYAEAIKDGVVEGDDLKNSLNIIIDESNRLKKVVNEIIYLTKVETINESYDFREVNLRNVLSKAITNINYLAIYKNININEELIDYFGSYDEEKLTKAFYNILENCLRYALKNVTVKMESLQNGVNILITDDGPGFAEGEENKIFNRFYKGKNGGTGIGLAVSKAIIEVHQGTISAVNNEGATFLIWLP